jgi:hypothetical protein
MGYSVASEGENRLRMPCLAIKGIGNRVTGSVLKMSA